MFHAEAISSLVSKIWGFLTTEVKITLYPTLFKKKNSWIGPKEFLLVILIHIRLRSVTFDMLYI